MHKIIIGVAMLLAVVITFPASGASVTIAGKTYDVSDTDAASMALDLTKKAEEPKPEETIKKVTQYAELGKALGAGLASTAKELGVTVNDFANTPVGHVATALLVYKFIGRDIIHYVFGTIWFAVFIPAWMYSFRRMAIVKSVNYTTDDKGKKQKIIKYYGEDRSDDVDALRFLMFLALAVISGVGIAVLFV